MSPIRFKFETNVDFYARPSSMVEQPAVVFGRMGEGIQPLSRHRLVPGSNPGGGTKNYVFVPLPTHGR